MVKPTREQKIEALANQFNLAYSNATLPGSPETPRDVMVSYLRQAWELGYDERHNEDDVDDAH